MIHGFFLCVGGGWLYAESPNSCYQNGWYKKKGKGEKDTIIYNQVVSDGAVNTWRTKGHNPNEQRNIILYRAKEDYWHVGW